MRQCFVALLALAVLAACTATIEPPRAKVVVPAIGQIDPPAATVVVVPAIDPPSPGFCPPGQAKKGRC
jgi:hypothetical protein